MSTTFVVFAPECNEGKAFKSCGVDGSIAARVFDAGRTVKSIPARGAAGRRPRSGAGGAERGPTGGCGGLGFEEL